MTTCTSSSTSFAETLYVNDAKRLTGLEEVWPHFPDLDPVRWSDYRQEARDILAWIEDALESNQRRLSHPSAGLE
jgi:hypothetical protein